MGLQKKHMQETSSNTGVHVHMYHCCTVGLQKKHMQETSSNTGVHVHMYHCSLLYSG